MLREFTLQLEISEGCRHSCTGCTVERDDNRFPTEEEFEKIRELVDDLEAGGVELGDLALGPTDILTSRNRDLCLADERKDLYNRFGELGLNCAFLSPKVEDYDWLIDRVNVLMTGKSVSLTIPFEIKHYKNVGYVEKLASRVQYFVDGLSGVSVQKIEIAFPQGTTTNETLFEKDVHEVLRLQPIFKHANFILVFNQGRMNLNDAIVKRSFLTGNEQYINSVKCLIEETDHVDDFKNDFRTGGGLVFRNGKFYLTPWVNGAFVTFHEEFEYKGPLTADGYVQEREQRLLDQIRKGHENGVCEGCQFIPTCSERDVIHLMELMDIKQCLSAFKLYPNYFEWKERYVDH